MAMYQWIIKTFKEYWWAEFCLNCNRFKANVYPCLKEGHIIVKRYKGVKR